jgi:5-methylcytosine-specific restriction enzyme subunit McrC
VNDIALQIAEWQTVSPAPGSPTQNVTLGCDCSVLEMARGLSEAGILEVLELRNGLMLRSTSFVGRVRLGTIEITVAPKLPTNALLKLLRYAYGLRDLRLFPSTSISTQATGFQDILVWQLIEEVKELRGRGLRRVYVRREEPLSSPRGRIDFRTLAVQGALPEASLPCIHHRREQDSLLNQVLLAGLRLATTLDVDRSLRVKAGRLADLIAEFVSPVRLDVKVLGRLEAGMDRTTRAYEPAISLIRILADAQGASLAEETRRRVPGFLFDMNRFFQALLERFLKDNLPDLSVQSEHRLTSVFAYMPGWNPRRQQAPVPRPDFLVSTGTKVVATLDAKYRDLWEQPLPSEMLYQLAIYATIHQGKAATILYPTTHEQAKEARIEVRDPSGGKRFAVVCLRPVPLDRMERLVTAKPTATVLRQRGLFAREMVFGRWDGNRDAACCDLREH